MKRLIAAGLVVSGAVLAGGDGLEALLKRGQEYAISVEGCAYADGYICPKPRESDFLNVPAQNSMISGNLLKAWQVAFSHFQSRPGLDNNQADLKHYKIGFTENDDHYIILFQGLLLPQVDEGKVTGYLTQSLGPTTKYWIDKRTFKVETSLDYK